MVDTTPLTKIGGYIASLFKGSQGQSVVNPQNNVICAASKSIDGQYGSRVAEIDEVPQGNREYFIDKMIAEMPLTPDRFKPSQRYFTNWSQYKLIHALFVRRDVSRRELGELVDIANIPDLVARMNRLGWSIRCRRKGMVDSSGRCRYRGYYSLSDEDRKRARWTLGLIQHGYA
jgi:hypothetical protein